MVEWLVFISVPLDLCLMPVLLELPVSVVKGADLPGLEPSGDAVEVEGVVAHAPRDGALLGGRRRLVGLALDAQVHDVVPADGAVVHDDVPGPQRHCVPLLHLEPLLLEDLAPSATEWPGGGHISVTIHFIILDFFKSERKCQI